jgi:hypothetical protein
MTGHDRLGAERRHHFFKEVGVMLLARAGWQARPAAS